MLKRIATAIAAGMGAFLITAALLNLPTLRGPRDQTPPPAQVAVPAPLPAEEPDAPADADAAFGPSDSDHASGAVRAIDGDTLAMAGRRIRIYGIDAPESAQTCLNSAGRYACGQRATDALAALVAGRLVTCVTVGRDRYRRDIARCHRDDGLDVGAEMVNEGWAVAYRSFSLDYVGREDSARLARRGIWSGAFDPPEAWRRGRR